MEKLEASANKERTRASELERELKRVKGRFETQQRIFNAQKSEVDLAKDKFKALEKRLNRTLLERDLLRRAIKDLEKKTGMLAERTELTPDEMAASDRKTEEAAQARQRRRGPGRQGPRRGLRSRRPRGPGRRGRRSRHGRGEAGGRHPERLRLTRRHSAG